MPKMKTNKGAAKRLHKTGGQRIARGRANRRHILSKKSRTRKRQLRQPASVDMRDMGRVLRLLPY
ncbi:MAG: 50S ribosomal protein L35 [Deltaproteobacteria bacterium]|nr:50S ribosomal protein L35 [Deltaproteobacteria bacterium]